MVAEIESIKKKVSIFESSERERDTVNEAKQRESREIWGMCSMIKQFHGGRN
jgi:hypothetical protein